MEQVKVLFVCMGNICRSPTAEGVFRRHVEKNNLSDRILIDSAGTHAYHVGNPPDQRSQDAAIKRDINLSDLRARCVGADDFLEFDYVLAMDKSNVNNLLSVCPDGYEDRLHLFLTFSDSSEREVPDPYYGQGRGFEVVLNLVEDAATGLLKHIRENH